MYEIKENNTVLMIAEITDIFFIKECLQEDGWLQLDKADSVTINGLDGYASPNLIERYKYAKPKRNE